MEIMLNKNSIRWQWPMIIYSILTVILITLDKATDAATTSLTTTSASVDGDTAQQTTTPEPGKLLHNYIIIINTMIIISKCENSIIN